MIIFQSILIILKAMSRATWIYLTPQGFPGACEFFFVIDHFVSWWLVFVPSYLSIAASAVEFFVLKARDESY